MDYDDIVSFTRERLTSLLNMNIVIEHIFFDGGDDFHNASTYIDRNLSKLKTSKDYFDNLKQGKEDKSGQMNILIWSRFVIMKEICSYIGEDHVSFGGLNTDK